MRIPEDVYKRQEEGTVLCRLGIEGESYEVVDGKYQLLDNIKNNPDGLTLDLIAENGELVHVIKALMPSH